jgi:hypothetical protein
MKPRRLLAIGAAVVLLVGAFALLRYSAGAFGHPWLVFGVRSGTALIFVAIVAVLIASVDDDGRHF